MLRHFIRALTARGEILAPVNFQLTSLGSGEFYPQAQPTENRENTSLFSHCRTSNLDLSFPKQLGIQGTSVFRCPRAGALKRPDFQRGSRHHFLKIGSL